jgi:PGF-pre-PGF domain-containing protein
MKKRAKMNRTVVLILCVFVVIVSVGIYFYFTSVSRDLANTDTQPPEYVYDQNNGEGPMVPNIIQTAAISSISPGQPGVVEINHPLIGARRLIISTNKLVRNVGITIKERNASSDEFQIGFSGVSYDTFDIIPENLTSDDVESIVIEFRVKKTELSKYNLTTNDVFLYRRPVGETDWRVLNTTYLSNERSYHMFSAVSPWLSTFLVFASKTECIPAEKRCQENQVQFCLGNKKWLVSEVCDYKCDDGKCVEKGLQVNLNPLIVYPIIGMVVVGVLISFMAQRMPKKAKNK